MGCDIHLYVEIKINGQWHTYNHPQVERNYSLFAKMAGVRGSDEIEPIAAPRELPDDISFVAKLDADYWGSDRHDSSYLTVDEIGELEVWCKEQDFAEGDMKLYWFEDQFGYLYGNPVSGLKRYPSGYPSQIQDVRFVFWFDN